MCYKNQLTETFVLNSPAGLGDHQRKYYKGDHFIYAALLQPGHHSFLIYDPENDRAYCKEMVVHANTQEFYSDMP